MRFPRSFARRLRAVSPRPESLTVGEHTFAVRWSARRRTVEIAVDASGGLRLAAPVGCTVAYLVEFARQKAPWVRAKVAERAAAEPPVAAPRFAAGSELPYLGGLVPVIATPRRRPVVDLVDGRFELAAEVASEEAARRGFVRWARRAAESWIAARVAALAPAVRAAPAVVRVREMGRRWGTCAPGGRLAFNWRLVLLAPELVDYVVVHELAHLHEHNHGPRFWGHVGRVLPDWRERRAALQRAAAAIVWSWER